MPAVTLNGERLRCPTARPCRTPSRRRARRATAAAWPWRSTARWCPRGRVVGHHARRRAARSRCCTRFREDEPARCEIADRTFDSRLILGTGGFRNLEALGAAVRASGAEMATVAMRRVDPGARGSLLEVLEDAGCFGAAEHRGLLHRARRRDHRAARARGAGDRLGEARGDRRRQDAAARRRRAARGRRDAGGRRLHGAALHQRRPRAGRSASRTRAAPR